MAASTQSLRTVRPRPPASTLRTTHEADGADLDVNIHGPVLQPDDRLVNTADVTRAVCQRYRRMTTLRRPHHGEQWCDGCASLPVLQDGTRDGRLAQWNEETGSLNPVQSPATRTLLSEWANTPYLTIDVDAGLGVEDPTVIGSEIRRGYMEGPNKMLHRLVTEIAPMLEGKHVIVEIKSRWALAVPEIYTVQMKSLAMLRCRELTFRGLPSHATQLAVGIRNLVVGSSRPFDLLYSYQILADRPGIRSEGILFGDLTQQLLHSALERDIGEFQRVRMRILELYNQHRRDAEGIDREQQVLIDVASDMPELR